MSLLQKPKFNTRRKKLLLVAVALLLLVPCVAAAAFAIRFEVDPYLGESIAQERERKEKLTEKDKEKLEELRAREVRVVEGMKERVALEDDERTREMLRKMETELEMRSIRQAALVRLSKINMDQAIQIATSQTPGKVLVCSLDAKGWEEPGKLGKDGVVFYRVVIADEVNPGATHVWVNAIDGTVIKTEKELPRKKRVPFEN